MSGSATSTASRSYMGGQRNPPRWGPATVYFHKVGAAVVAPQPKCERKEKKRDNNQTITHGNKTKSKKDRVCVHTGNANNMSALSQRMYVVSTSPSSVSSPGLRRLRSEPAIDHMRAFSRPFPPLSPSAVSSHT